MHRVRTTVGIAVLLVAVSLAVPAHADPAEPVVPADPIGAAPVEAPPTDQPLAAPLPVEPDSGDAVAVACKQFNAAINVAAVNYEDFAYATAGGGNVVNYDDPTVERSNVIGRTALRAAAVTAMDASRTPGLPPEVADPMRSWSLHATKLLLVMGLRGGGDQLNASATQLNTDASDTQMACAMDLTRR